MKLKTRLFLDLEVADEVENKDLSLLREVEEWNFRLIELVQVE